MTDFRILTVCTGNICRSPMAAIMLRRQLRSVPEAQVDSAGTGALVGSAMPPEARAIVEGLGLQDEPVHIAQQLRAEHVRSANLILALTREHRRKVVQLDPSATRRAFTLREFGFVAGHVTDADLDEAERQLVWRRSAEGLDPRSIHPLDVATAAVFTANGVFPIPDPSELDVTDPFMGPIEAYAEAAVRMLPAIEAISEFFTAHVTRPVGLVTTPV